MLNISSAHTSHLAIFYDGTNLRAHLGTLKLSLQTTGSTRGKLHQTIVKRVIVELEIQRFTGNALEHNGNNKAQNQNIGRREMKTEDSHFLGV